MVLKKHLHKHSKVQTAEIGKSGNMKGQMHLWLIGILAFLLYAQTLSYEYVYDDASIITENNVTRQGLAGIKTMFSHAYWYGLQGSNQGVYRPLSQLSFAIDWQFFPNNPAFAHFINILLYSICCMLLFKVLMIIFKKSNPWIPFFIGMLFTVHPIHTEVVANIKSRDEIICMLFGLLSCLKAFSYLHSHKKASLILSSVFFFMSLLCKENGIAFIFIIPLILYITENISLRKLISFSGIWLLPTILFLILRNQILEPMQAISTSDNAILASTSMLDQLATAVYILGRYILLLLFPIQLSCDYSFAEITPKSFSSPFVLISVFIYAASIIYTYFHIKNKNNVSLFILIFLISLFPVSNLLLTIGTAMAERFLFIPSLGFISIPIILLAQYFKMNDFDKEKDFSFFSQIKKHKIFFMLFIVLGFIFSILSIQRNKAWKSNLNLFSTDVVSVPNSARIHNNYGNALYKKGDLKLALTEFNLAIRLNPSFDQAYNNAALVYGQSGQLDTCIALLKKAMALTPNYVDAHNSMGIALGGKGLFDESILEFETVLKLNPSHSQALKNLGLTYYNKKDYSKSLEMLNKALSLNKNDADVYQIMGLNYKALGDEKTANEMLNKAQSLR